MPPMLPVGDGRQLPATDELLQAVYQLAELQWRNETSLKPRFKIGELANLYRDSFGEVLSALDPDKDDEELVSDLGKNVSDLLSSRIRLRDRPVDLTLGCHLFEGEAAYPIRVGPVVFETREQWRLRLVSEGRISYITARRLASRWAGSPIRKRKRSFDEDAETEIFNSVGDCSTICTVSTRELSSANTKEKGILAARMAMAAIALIWPRPSQTLEWMNLLYDRRLDNRYTVQFSSGTHVGFSHERGQLPCGKFVDQEEIEILRNYGPLLEQIGEALTSYAQPSDETKRPNLMNALFLSLWWFHEACREPLDQIAVTKFAASMDALVKGQDAHAILRFIEARTGIGPKDTLITTGLTTEKVMDKIYGKGRSQLIHGSSKDFSHDWSEPRAIAEVVGRMCLVEACGWMAQNGSIDCVEALSER
ncbi:MAG: hypothetical protein GW855_12230 [Erythrobacter sp.]|nr:hypothetical protein [Erythrobacter sp.]NCQ62968.1 hypothetical protein [Alphaproteobacteria bacterium]